ncbi:hypothetical protein [Superficieibacter sp. HKU1]|uniref:hypothetical protein n=1 Tax=Superficieibacter sp. HKU1 TaxID=3031919 RepID=UPI0023E22713|nr:hypothetical protein [Superficieibacter sp. HKU1]WES67629.1 hypothetical protein P0H77_18770 [Superficieibacter sp. HKU1]
MKNTIDEISKTLKEKEWCDMEIDSISNNDLIIKGCMELTDQDYFIEFKFCDVSYIDAPLSWTVDTREECIFKYVDKKLISVDSSGFQKYFHLGGDYMFSFLADFFNSKDWIHIVANSVEYRILT